MVRFSVLETSLSTGDFLVILVCFIAQCGLATPNFWVALLLILVFSIQLGWFDASGFPGWGAPLAALKALVLPALALALPQAAILLRVSRAAILEVAREDYVRTARAKGLTQRATLLRHVLGNAMMPILTVMGLQLAVLLAGSIIVENVFVLPGLGRLVFQLGPQDLRQNFSSYAASLGVPASVCALWQGHSPAVAERYYRTQVPNRLDGDSIEKAMGLGRITETRLLAVGADA